MAEQNKLPENYEGVWSTDPLSKRVRGVENIIRSAKSIGILMEFTLHGGTASLRKYHETLARDVSAHLEISNRDACRIVDKTLELSGLNQLTD